MEVCNKKENCNVSEACGQLLEDIKNIKANLYICLGNKRGEKINWYQGELKGKYKELQEKINCLDALRMAGGDCFKS